jgi:hypothetical protein
MKKLIFIPLLFLFVFCEAQFSGRGSSFLKTGTSFMSATVVAEEEGYSTEYEAVLTAMTTDPSTTNKGYQNTMVEALVDGGYWARMDLFYVFATEVNTASESLINWIDPGTFNASLFNAPAWAAYEGYTGDGGYNFLESNYNPSSDNTHYALDDAGFGIYLRTNLADPTAVFGAKQTGTNQIHFSPYNAGGSTFRINTDSYTSTNAANTSGFWQGTRTASNVVELYRNGGSVVTDNSTSTAIPNAELYILAHEVGASSTNQIAIFMLMDAFDDTEADEINDIIETYMDAIGKGVE